jgi:integrase
MAKSSDAWPNTILSLASARGQLLLPFSACPASFNEDVEVYKEKLKGQNLDEFFGITIEGDAEPDAFDEIAAETLEGFGRTSGAVLLRPETVKSKVDQIKAAFNALHRAGVPLSEITSLASLVTPLDRPRMIMSQLLRENGGNTKPVIGHVADMLRQLAKYHVKLPPKHVAKLAEWAKKVRFGYHEMTGRNRKMLAQIYTPQRLNTLRNMPDALMDRADKLRPSFRGAVAARRAAMLVLLTRAPMRLGNLLTLRFDEHLVRPDPKTKRISAIVIDADETKNRQGLTYALSERTSAILQRWITEFRPLLTSAGNPYLFGGKGVQPMTRAGIRDTVKAITFECLGVPINPHLFRHLAATVYLEACPGGFEDVRRLLGHKTLQTTTRAYTRIENEASVKRFDKILDDIDETMGLALKPAKKCRPKPKHAAKRPTPNRS